MVQWLRAHLAKWLRLKDVHTAHNIGWTNSALVHRLCSDHSGANCSVAKRLIERGLETVILC